MKKQRVIIVEDQKAKEDLKRSLLNPSSFNITLPGIMKTDENYQRTMSDFGKKLSGRIITAAERKQQDIKLEKLYIEATSMGIGSQEFAVDYRKTPPLEAASLMGFTAGALAGGITAYAGATYTTVAKVAAAVGTATFATTAINQELATEIKTHTTTCNQMARKLISCELHCRDIRILSYNSGDRTAPRDITSAHDRERARNNPKDRLSFDEALANSLRIYPSAKRFENISGYQGLCGFSVDSHHLTRRSKTTDLQGKEDEKEIRQKETRVSTKI